MGILRIPCQNRNQIVRYPKNLPGGESTRQVATQAVVFSAFKLVDPVPCLLSGRYHKRTPCAESQ